MVLFLLGRGVAIDVDQVGNLALTIAARSSHEPVMRLLVERGVPVNRNVVEYPHHLLMREHIVISISQKRWSSKQPTRLARS